MKIRITKLAALAMGLLSLSLLGGCASMTNPSRLHELRPDSSYAIDMDATRRAAYVIRKDQPIGICAEPAPDVSVGGESLCSWPVDFGMSLVRGWLEGATTIGAPLVDESGSGEQ